MNHIFLATITLAGVGLGYFMHLVSSGFSPIALETLFCSFSVAHY